MITWNPDDIHSSVSLSNNNLTATLLNSSNSFARAHYNDLDKFYFEVKVDSSTNSNIMNIGIGTKDSVKYSDCILYKRNSGDIDVNGSTIISDTPDEFIVGDSVGIAVDKINDEISFYNNGVFQAKTNIYEYLETFEVFPYLTTGASNATNTIIYTGNFGAKEFDLLSSNPEQWATLVNEGYRPYDEYMAEWFRLLIQTLQPTNIDFHEATLRGEVKYFDQEEFDEVEVWFEKGTQSIGHQTLTIPDTFQHPISGLSPGEAYKYKAMASATNYGGE